MIHPLLMLFITLFFFWIIPLMLVRRGMIKIILILHKLWVSGRWKAVLKQSMFSFTKSAIDLSD
jgi:hypothetical protein